MKTLALLLLTVGVPSNFTFSDSKGDLAIVAKQGQGSMVGDGLHLDLRGSVRIASRKQSFVLTANRVVADAGPGKGSKAVDEIKKATATGGVKLVQSADNVSTNLQCAIANYRLAGDAAIVDCQGSVRIQNFDVAKQQAIVATGGSGTATLDKKAKEGFGLREATLTHSVKVDVLDSTTKGGHAIFTGDKLTMTPNRITLTGNVKAQGNGTARFANLGKVDSIVVNLNDRKEMTSFSFKSGGGK